MTLVSRLQRPEHTGKNRCIPCTAANVAIAALGSAVLAITSTMLGVIVFVASVVVIYLRGYLIPGTPTLTKQYFPDYVLRWFDKEPTSISIDEIGKSIRIDPEQVLLNARAVTLCKGGADLCLHSSFQTNWRERQGDVQEQNSNEEDILDALNTHSEQISVERYGDAFVAGTDDQMIGQWPSSAAVIADIAAAEELAESYPGWERLNPAERARVLTSLRVFIDQCPECNSPVQIKQEVVNSCCRSYDVVVSACRDCEAQLFEVKWNDEFAATPDIPNDQSDIENSAHMEI